MKGRKQKQRVQPLAAAALQDHLCRQFAVGSLEKKRRGQCRQPLPRSYGDSERTQVTKSSSGCAKCGSKGVNSVIGTTTSDYSLDPRPPPLTLAQRLGLVDVPTQYLTDEDWVCVKRDSNKRQDSALPCPICQEEFGLGKQALLSCSHVFHLVCLKSFERFSRSKRCPLCRRENYKTRVIFEGANIHKEKAATLIQSVWRGYVVRRWYLDLREKVPPTNPILRKKYFESKLSRLTEQIVASCAVRSEDVEAMLIEADTVVKNAQSVRRVFDLCTKDILDWGLICELSKHHLSSDCAVCLMPLHPVPSTPTVLTASQLHTSTCSQQQPCSKQVDLLSPVTTDNHRPLSVLSCSHLLHTNCIEALEQYCLDRTLFLCPLCRTPYHRKPFNC